MKEMIVGVNGVSFEQSNVKRFACEDVGSYELVRQPDNVWDSNAIAVKVGDYQMGYLPAVVAKSLAPAMDSGKHLVARFHKRLDGFVGPGALVGFQILIKETFTNGHN